MFKTVALAPAIVAASTLPALAATGGGVDYTPLTSAIDVTSTSAAILSVGAVVIGVTLAVMGVRKVIGMVRGA